MNLKNIKKRIYAEQRDNINTNKINVIFNGDVIITSFINIILKQKFITLFLNVILPT